jgi:asparagine synthase (glutamine-hydrolysing)
MCGLSGFVSKNGLKPSSLLAMNSSIKHRGPDDEGYALFSSEDCSKSFEFIGNDSPKELLESGKFMHIGNLTEDLDNNNFNVALAHRRLSILDLSIAGHQPMKDSTGRFWIVFNGEIYNYKELRSLLLKLGHEFQTESDTEVIINSYKEWGVDCLHKFNGMFAFVLYDSVNSKFFIARDRLGVKPFYYSVQNGNFFFGSEIKCILAMPEILVKPNIKWLTDYLRYGPNEYDEFTSFSNILKLKSGNYIESNSEDLFNGLFETRVWWNIDDLINDTIDRNEFDIELEKFNELFTDAVRLRTRSDVPIGCAFSGGLDSSAILSKMINFNKEVGDLLKVETFSNVYKTVGTEYCDESEYIDSVILNLNVNNSKIEPTFKDLIKFYHEITYLQENPSMSTGISGYMTYKLMKNNGIVVSLDGQGADEQLAGYSGYYVNWLYNKSVKNIIINIYKLNHFISKRTLLNVIVGIVLMKTIPNVILKKISSYRSITYDMTPEGLNLRLLNDIKMNLS